MDRSTADTDSYSLEERIRLAKAERSVAIGVALGEALDALWRVIGSLPFSPSAKPARKQGASTKVAPT